MFCKPFVVVCCLLTLASAAVAEDEAVTQREQEFSERMSGTVLVGAFTVDGLEPLMTPKEERYEIKSVRKSSGNIWVFTARVKYMQFDATLPIPVPVVWADDTPMVSLTDARIPGLGEGFSCRVIFDGDRYAGTWQHGKNGGHMYGRIEKPSAESAETESTPESEAAE